MRSLVQTARSVRALAGHERGAAIRAFAWLTAARVALRIAPYAALCRWVARVPRRTGARSLSAHECGGAVLRAGRLGRGATCLARALAADCLLRREGRQSTLSLGVRRDAQGELHAHAWVTSAGVPVAGGEEAAQYIPLTPSRHR